LFPPSIFPIGQQLFPPKKPFSEHVPVERQRPLVLSATLSMNPKSEGIPELNGQTSVIFPAIFPLIYQIPLKFGNQQRTNEGGLPQVTLHASGHVNPKRQKDCHKKDQQMYLTN
jgi:hypothetical protein